MRLDVRIARTRTEEVHIKDFGGQTSYLDVVDIDGNITFNCVFETWNGGTCSGFMCFKIARVGGLLRMRTETPISIKFGEILDEL